MRAWLTLLLIIGFTLICLPIGWILTSPSVVELRKQREYIATWPSVTGRLDRVTFQEELHTARGVIWYYVEVGYRYTVAGREYKGDLLGIDTRHYRHTSPEALKAQMYSSFMSPVCHPHTLSGGKRRMTGPSSDPGGFPSISPTNPSGYTTTRKTRRTPCWISLTTTRRSYGRRHCLSWPSSPWAFSS